MTRPKVKRPRSRRGEGDKLREEILDATEALLSQTADRRAVSIRAVAEAVGVTAPSIYRHFPDKRALLMAACQRHFDDLQQRLEKMASVAEGPIDAPRETGHAYLDWGMDNPEEYRIMFMTRPESDAVTDGEEMDYSDTIGPGTAFGALISMIDTGLQAGEIRADRNIFDVAIAVFSLVHGVTSLAISNDPQFFPRTDAHRTLDLLMDWTFAGLAPAGLDS